MRSISLILAGMVFSVLSTAQDWEIRIDRYLQAQMDTFHIPALSAAIVENGVVIYKRTFGMAVPEFKIRNADTTAFQLASATKLIAATAMMTLVQENKLTKTVYAGGDYAVIMRMIERITGTDYQTFLRRNLLDKLQMNHTGYNNMSQDFIYRTSDVLPFAATVYTWDENTKKQRIFSMMFPSWSYPAGGLFASVGDLVKWIAALDKNTLLRPEIQEQMWTATKLRNGQTAPFGVGWIVDKYQDEKVTGHSGGRALAYIVRLPGRKLTIMILTNQLNLRPILAMQVMKIYLGD